MQFCQAWGWDVKVLLRSFLLIASLMLPLAAQPRRIAVIAHRGEHLRHTENTLAGYRAAYDAGADFVEVDVRTTKDGRLVLMHDATVDRTTSGHGAVAEMSFAAVRALDGGIVPTLDEAMELAAAPRGVYLDCKQVAPGALVDAIARHRMADRVVIYGGPDFLRQVRGLNSSLKIMPEARNASTLRDLIDTLHLRIAAFDAHDFDDATIAVAKAAKLDIYVDRLGSNDTPAAWQDAIDRGATGIQTDKPAELAGFLTNGRRTIPR
jgi:glycerophosphoryl diester phosphodiesterase